jgi:hypothetical protein
LNLLETISNFIAPVSKVIDEVHTSDEERANLRNKLFSMQSALQIKVLEYEKNLLTKQSEIISAEALGNGLLQRNWRPITMLTFLILVVLDSFGWLANPLAPEAWVLLQIGLGGYVVGRSAEKLAKPISHAIKK